jgi:hypothetical protein
VTGIVLFAALLWSACIGWFLDNAAPAQVQEVMFQELLAGHTVAPAVGQRLRRLITKIKRRKLYEHSESIRTRLARHPCALDLQR